MISFEVAHENISGIEATFARDSKSLQRIARVFATKANLQHLKNPNATSKHLHNLAMC
jgi:hypothetical protein